MMKATSGSDVPLSVYDINRKTSLVSPPVSAHSSPTKAIYGRFKQDSDGTEDARITLWEDKIGTLKNVSFI